jgi:DNA-binding transcriptional regulator WhiA
MSLAVRATAGPRPAEHELSAAWRAELAAIEPARRCCRAAERAGLGPAAQGRARTPLLGRLAVRLDDGARGASFEREGAAQHCRLAYLRGALLARGSLSVGPAGAHLELTVAPGDLAAMSSEVAALDLAASSRIRRGRGVLTWKSADTIIGLLRRLGATSTTLALEGRLINRAVQEHMNRVVNAEHANLRRAVSAARRQLADIDTLTTRGHLRLVPAHVRRVAAARRRAPEATLAELAAELDLSRGQVQRAFELIGSAALHEGGDD